MDPKELKQLLAILEENGITEFELEDCQIVVGATAAERRGIQPVAIVTAISVLSIGAITRLPATAAAVATKGLPLAVPVGRKDHFSAPVVVSTPNRPPRFDEFPPMIIVPAGTVGDQSRNPGFTVNFSVGAFRSGAIPGDV